MLIEGRKSGGAVEYAELTDDNRPKVDASVSIDSVTVSNVEISNDVGNPIPMVGSATRSTATATIATAGTTSTVVDLNGTSLLGFVAPAAWTTATLRLQGSPDNSTWCKILDPDGADVSSWIAVTAGAAYSVDVAAMLPYRYIRFVAGAAQGAERVFTVITRPLA